MNGSEKVKK